MAKKEKKVKEPKVKEPKAKKEKKEKKEKKAQQPKAPKMPKKPKKEKKAATGIANRIIGNPVRVLIVTAIVSAIMGVALFQFYTEFKDYFDFIIGALIALIGLVSVIAYFVKPMISGVYRSEFAVGLVCIGLGVYIALNGGVSFSLLVVIGVLVLVDAIIKLQYTLDLVRLRLRFMSCTGQ